jgi:hypothetical protein
MIEVLKQALEALTINSDRVTEIGKQREAITSLRQAIAELESQERNFCPRCGKRTNDIHTCTPPQIKTTDSFESEKVADYNRGWNDCLFASGIVKQSQRTWQGLTDEEVKHEWEVWRANVPRYVGFAKGIEDKLKKLNT